MVNANKLAAWTREFEKADYNIIRDNLHAGNFHSEQKRQHAIRWLADQGNKRGKRDAKMLRYVCWTFWAAVAAVVVGIVTIAVTLTR
jgi:hypothetical protein